MNLRAIVRGIGAEMKRTRFGWGFVLGCWFGVGATSLLWWFLVMPVIWRNVQMGQSF